MKTICAWCLAYISGDIHATEISHGICPECEAKYLAELDD